MQSSSVVCTHLYFLQLSNKLFYHSLLTYRASLDSPNLALVENMIASRQEVYSYMPQVKVRENEPFEVALRRFKRSCEKAGILSEIRRREHYEKPTQVRKRKQAAAVKRHLKRLQREQQRRQRFY